MPAITEAQALEAFCDFVDTAASGAPVYKAQTDAVPPNVAHLTVQVIDEAPIGHTDAVVNLGAGTVAAYDMYEVRYQVDAYGVGGGAVLKRLKAYAEGNTTHYATLVAAGVTWQRMSTVRNNTGALLSGMQPRSTVTCTTQYVQVETTTTACSEIDSLTLTITGTGANDGSVTPDTPLP